MKKSIKLFARMIAVCASGILLLSGCGSSGAQAQSESQITVTFMNGDETLGTVTANAGELLDAASYESYENGQDAEFQGWYEAPTFIEASYKDLTVDTFEEDTTLYGNFAANDVTEDTRKWYVVGASTSGILADSQWAGALSDEEKEQFELKPTGNNTNEFAITIDLYAGDEFQLIADWAWDTQKGYGLFTDIDDTQLESGGSLGGEDNKANVNVLVDGNYTITLTTNPDNSAQDTISVVRNGDIQE